MIAQILLFFNTLLEIKRIWTCIPIQNLVSHREGWGLTKWCLWWCTARQKQMSFNCILLEDQGYHYPTRLMVCYGQHNTLEAKIVQMALLCFWTPIWPLKSSPWFMKEQNRMYLSDSKTFLILLPLISTFHYFSRNSMTFPWPWQSCFTLAWK